MSDGRIDRDLVESGLSRGVDRMFKRFACSAMLAAVCLAPVAAQRPGAPGAPQQQPQPTPTTPATRDEPGGTAPSQMETAGPKEEKISQTQHVVRLDGREIRYTATTGTLPIRLDD